VGVRKSREKLLKEREREREREIYVIKLSIFDRKGFHMLHCHVTSTAMLHVIIASP